MIDSHSHIFHSQFDEDRAETILRAKAIGVTALVMPDIDASTRNDMLDIAKQYVGYCYPTMGLHPTSINENSNWRADLKETISMIRSHHKNIVGIGEIGLDYYWSTEYVSEQKEALINQIEVAQEFNLPVILHVRDAWSDMIKILKKHPNLKGVLHSFSGNSEHLDVICKMKYLMIGINGTITYKNSVLGDTISSFPLERIVLETDAPYLPPVPYRGKRNEPSYLELVALKLAQDKSVNIEVIKTITAENTKRLFGI